MPAVLRDFVIENEKLARDIIDDDDKDGDNQLREKFVHFHKAREQKITRQRQDEREHS